jgi:hypothetical protein
MLIAPASIASRQPALIIQLVCALFMDRTSLASAINVFY